MPFYFVDLGGNALVTSMLSIALRFSKSKGEVTLHIQQIWIRQATSSLGTLCQ